MKKTLTKLITASALIASTQLLLAKKEPSYPAGFSPKTTSGVSFTENKGQIHDQNYNARPDVLFGGTDGNLVFHLKNNGISYQLNRVDSWKEAEDKKIKEKIKVIDKSTIYRLDVNWLNTNTNAQVVKGISYAGFNNYYLANCPNGALNVQSFENVTYQNIYSGIDLKWYQKEGHLKYDYLVAAGANYKQIQLQFNGAAAIKLNSKGELVLTTPLGDIIEQAPMVTQNHKVLKSNWVVNNNVISFNIENVNPDQAFVIDPTVRVWGTYYGDAGSDQGRSCSTDASGNVYMAGLTDASTGTMVATSGAHQSAYGGGGLDAFLVKFNSSGVRQWGTYYGGTANENGYGCATDASGNVYLTGITSSTNAINTAGAHQTVYGGGIFDGFLVKFNSSGVRQWGTYYGGLGDDRPNSCTTDAAGNVYITGSSDSPGAITTAGAHQTVYGGNTDAFLVKFNSAGVRQWGTYYGDAAGYDVTTGCTTDVTGNIYIAGATSSSLNIATAAAQQTTNAGGSNDAFLVKFNSTGVRQWGTYYGTSGTDFAWSCATDASGNVYLAGETDGNTSTAIATAGAYQTTAGGGGQVNAFLAQFNASGARQWGTYYQSFGSTRAYSCATDATGNVYIAGATDVVSNFSNIVTIDAQQATISGNTDGFFAKFNTSGARQYGTFYGAASNDYILGCATDASNNVYFAGYTNSSTSTLIATVGSHQQTSGGGAFESFLVRFANCSQPTNPTGSGVTSCANNSATLTASSGTATINWYATASSTTVLGTGAFITPTLSAGTYTYYAEAFTCVPSLARTAITLTVNSSPTISVNSGAICNGQSFTISPSGANTYTFQGGSAIVSPIANSSYTVIGTNSFGCVSSVFATSNVTVNANPTVTVNSGAICIGNSFTIIPSGASTYTISGGSSVVTPTTNATYNITGTSALGCVSSNTAVSSVTVNALPTVIVNASSASVCIGSSVTLTGSGATTYTWNNGVTNGSPFSPTATVNYIVSGTSLSGCTNTANITVTVTSVASPTISTFTYTPLVLTGFNQDIVASGNNFVTSTTADVDGSGTRLIDSTFIQFGTPYPGRHLPTGGIINSITSPNPTFQLASYAANNSLRLPTSGNTGTLTLATPTRMDMFYLLATSGSGSSIIDVQVFFTDNTSQTISNLLINDWFNASNSAMTGIGRVYNNALDFNLPTSTNPRLYQYAITLLPANTTKTVSAVKFTSVNGATTTKITHILGITAGAAAQEFCQSSNLTVATLTATGSNLQWYNSSNVLLTNTVSLINGNTYNVTQTIGGCQSQPVSVLVSIKPLPTVNAISTASLLCSGQTATLTASGASSYIWNTTATTAVIAVTPTTTTSYTVTGTGTNGCVKTTTIVQNVSTCTGIDNLLYKGDDVSFMVYPNPNNGVFTIEVGANTTMELIDVLGKTILKQQLEVGRYNLNITEYANGVYFIKAISNNNLKTIRVVKQ